MPKKKTHSTGQPEQEETSTNSEQTASEQIPTPIADPFLDRRTNPEWAAFKRNSDHRKKNHTFKERRDRYQPGASARWWLFINYVDNEYFDAEQSA